MSRNCPSAPTHNYAGQDLRNRSFKEKDLGGADFSHADIRGCNFEDADLTGTSFAYAKAGQSLNQRRVFVVEIITGLVAGTVSSTNTLPNAVAGIVSSARLWVGVGTEMLTANQTALIGNAPLGTLIVGLGAVLGAGALAGAIATMVITMYVGTWAFVDSSSGDLIADMSAGARAGAGASAIVVVCAVGSSAFKVFFQGAILEGAVLSSLAFLIATAALYFGWELTKAYCNLPGTCFKRSILVGADFNHAILRITDFTDANLAQVNWTDVNLQGSSFDKETHVVRLLISRNGYEGNYSNANLANEYLCGVDISQSNLYAANLSNANLQHADLSNANLSDAQALGTDFSNAILTGACIQNWGINSDTIFTDVCCDYIYLSPERKPEDRRPLAGSFDPGDFEKLVDKFADTLDFIFRQSTDPAAFKFALQKLFQDHDGASIKAITALKDHEAVVQVTLSPGTSKVEPYIQTQNKILKGRVHRLEGENAILKEHYEDAMVRLVGISRNEQYIIAREVTFNRDNMTDKSINPKITGNKGDVFYTGRDVLESVVGKDQTGVGAKIEGDLNLTIDHLKQSPDPKAVQLADLLKQVKEAIDSPTAGLDDKHKARAQKYLADLGKIAGGSERSPGLLEKADENLELLEGVIKKGSGLAELAQTHLPTFTAIVRSLLGIG